VVTDVGGLHDTVFDADARPSDGTGFVAPAADPLALLDALHRGARGLRVARRRDAIRKRGMQADWSWLAPAQEHLTLYEQLADVSTVDSRTRSA
jgi:glycogen synthase